MAPFNTPPHCSQLDCGGGGMIIPSLVAYRMGSSAIRGDVRTKRSTQIFCCYLRVKVVQYLERVGKFRHTAAGQWSVPSFNTLPTYKGALGNGTLQHTRGGKRGKHAQHKCLLWLRYLW